MFIIVFPFVCLVFLVVNEPKREREGEERVSTQLSTNIILAIIFHSYPVPWKKHENFVEAKNYPRHAIETWNEFKDKRDDRLDSNFRRKRNARTVDKLRDSTLAKN